jgi:hypothetical protein
MGVKMKKTLFADTIFVHYGQFYVCPGKDDVELEHTFRGQVNGLCGAALANRLYLVTGTHTGQVHVEVELFESEPAINTAWDEIVEVSFHHDEPTLELVEWAGEATYRLELPAGEYRVRYGAKGMIHDDEDVDDQKSLQHYRLQFWPDTPRPDAVVKVSGRCAKYWHAEAAKSQRAA